MSKKKRRTSDAKQTALDRLTPESKDPLAAVFEKVTRALTTPCTRTTEEQRLCDYLSTVIADRPLTDDDFSNYLLAKYGCSRERYYGMSYRETARLLEIERRIFSRRAKNHPSEERVTAEELDIYNKFVEECETDLRANFTLATLRALARQQLRAIPCKGAPERPRKNDHFLRYFEQERAKGEKSNEAIFLAYRIAHPKKPICKRTESRDTERYQGRCRSALAEARNNDKKIV